jgi:plasmid stability protein
MPDFQESESKLQHGWKSGRSMVPLWYHYGVVANLTIKKLPDPVYKKLKKYAKAQGRSLNAQVIRILQSDVSERERLEKMRRPNKDLERFIASLPPMDDSTPLIREDRNGER